MRQTLAQMFLAVAALGIFCTGAAFCYWTIQGAYGVLARMPRLRQRLLLYGGLFVVGAWANVIMRAIGAPPWMSMIVCFLIGWYSTDAIRAVHQGWRNRKVRRASEAIAAIKREQMTEHWVRTEGWK